MKFGTEARFHETTHHETTQLHSPRRRPGRRSTAISSYVHSLLKEPIAVKGGFAAVPDRPGLGFELDRDAVEKFRVERPKERPDPPRLVEVSWPDGRRLYLSSNNQVNFVLNHGNKGTIPFYERGAAARLYPDDGTPRWRRLYEAACKEPALETR